MAASLDAIGQDHQDNFMTPKRTAEFFKSLNKTDSCWNWRSSAYWDGYGMFSVNGKQRRAHRVSWEIHNSKIPEGLFVLHRCDNRKCVRPSHLFLGTKKDNSLDMVSKGRHRHQVFHGERHPNAKLSDSVIREIRAIANTFLTQKQIGEIYGVSDVLVGLIIRRKAWAHVK